MELKKKLELKGLIDTIILQFKEIMTLTPFKNKVDAFISSEYIKGLETIEGNLKPTINFVPNRNDLDFLKTYVFQNLQKHSEEVGDNLRQEIQRGILNKDTPEELQQKVKDVFKDKVYTNRLKTVMRTEKLRANNSGAFEGAKQAAEVGIHLKKYLDVTMDDDTTLICEAEDEKYGTKEDAIPLDEEFTVKAGNKTYSALVPPFHINCRTVVKFVRDNK